ncbi:hypothetical protein [Streptomyces sp. NBC_00448]|uniref:hypothetical protein n=1 Tax=Streptomyces sp. NBC_00448 TaxID=2903652 RepID=UPI002E1E910F
MRTPPAAEAVALSGPAASSVRQVPPAAVLAAFLVALVAVFAVAWSVGHAAGPVNPRMHPAPAGVRGSMDGGSGSGGTHGMAGMR